MLLAYLPLPKEMALIKLEHHSKQQDLESWDNEPFSWPLCYMSSINQDNCSCNHTEALEEFKEAIFNCGENPRFGKVESGKIQKWERLHKDNFWCSQNGWLMPPHNLKWRLAKTLHVITHNSKDTLATMLNQHRRANVRVSPETFLKHTLLPMMRSW